MRIALCMASFSSEVRAKASASSSSSVASVERMAGERAADLHDDRVGVSRMRRGKDDTSSAGAGSVLATKFPCTVHKTAQEERRSATWTSCYAT